VRVKEKRHLNQNKGKRKRSRRRGGERRRREEQEPLSPQLETVCYCLELPSVSNDTATGLYHSVASEAVRLVGHRLLRTRYTFLPPLFFLVVCVFFLHAERMFCMQEDRGKIIPPGWFSNARPGRFWASTDGFLSLGQAGSGPVLMCLWARLILAQPCCLGRVWPRQK